jgi:hypothetical protein
VTPADRCEERAFIRAPIAWLLWSARRCFLPNPELPLDLRNGGRFSTQPAQARGRRENTPVVSCPGSALGCMGSGTVQDTDSLVQDIDSLVQGTDSLVQGTDSLVQDIPSRCSKQLKGQ